ncbi:unnamed protein product, partial [marine sediment metagenome]
MKKLQKWLTMFRLTFNRKEISYWSNRYPAADDYQVEKIIAPQVRNRGYFTKPDFLAICYWKTPRNKPMVEKNLDKGEFRP